jgi:hypothetical protein
LLHGRQYIGAVVLSEGLPTVLRRFASFRRVIASVAIFVVVAAAMSIGSARAHMPRALESAATDTGAPCHKSQEAQTKAAELKFCDTLCDAAAPNHFLGDTNIAPAKFAKAKATFSVVATMTPTVTPVTKASVFASPPLADAQPLYLRTQRLLI